MGFGNFVAICFGHNGDRDVRRKMYINRGMRKKKGNKIHDGRFFFWNRAKK